METWRGQVGRSRRKVCSAAFAQAKATGCAFRVFGPSGLKLASASQLGASGAFVVLRSPLLGCLVCPPADRLRAEAFRYRLSLSRCATAS